MSQLSKIKIWLQVLLSLLFINNISAQASLGESTLKLAKEKIQFNLNNNDNTKAFELCDSIFNSHLWTDDEEKLHFYLLYFDVLEAVYEIYQSSKNDLLNLEHDRFEEFIELAYQVNREKYIQNVFNCIELHRSLYLEKRLNPKRTQTQEKLKKEWKSSIKNWQEKKNSSDTTGLSILNKERKIKGIELREFKRQSQHSYQTVHFKYSKTDLDSLQKLIPDDEALIIYFFGEKNLNPYSILITPSNKVLLKLNKTEKIEDAFITYQKNINPQLRIERFARNNFELYKLIFEPFQVYLRDIKRLIIIPDKFIGLIGFDALISDMPKMKDWDCSYDEIEYLIDNFQIRYQLSTANYLKSKSSINKKYIHTVYNPNLSHIAPVFDADFKSKTNISKKINDAPSLSSSAKISEHEIKPLFEKTGTFSYREDATAEQLFINLKNSDIIFLLTHMVINKNNIDSSYVILAPKTKSSNQVHRLRFHELKDKLDSIKTNFIILGSCQSGRGIISRGEGLTGLVRIFNLYGIDNSIYSLWSVDEEATMLLFSKFFENLKLGETIDFALHDAKLTVRNDHRFQAPFFWAGFIFSGDSINYQFSKETSLFHTYFTFQSIIIFFLILGLLVYIFIFKIKK